MNDKRKKYIIDSNNSANPNQNVCAHAIAYSLGVHDKVHYLHTISDLVRALRKKYEVRSRKSYVKGKTVGAIRKELKELDGYMYLVRVSGHALLLNSDGETVVDTDKRKRDARKCTHLYAIYPKHYFKLIEAIEVGYKKIVDNRE